MATLTWLGGPGEPDTNEWGGHTFSKGEGVEIDDPRMIAKARNNRFYTVTGDDDSDADPAQVRADRARAEQERDPNGPFDHDGDGKPGGSLPRRPGRPPTRR